MVERFGLKFLPDLRGGDGPSLVEADANAELLDRGPERIVVGVVPRAPIDEVRPQEDAPEPIVPHRPARLFHSGGHVVQRDHRDAEHPVGVPLAELVEPVVVGRGYRGAQRGIDAVDGEGHEPPAWIHGRDVDALGVHRLDLGLRVPHALDGVRVLAGLVLLSLTARLDADFVFMQ